MAYGISASCLSSATRTIDWSGCTAVTLSFRVSSFPWMTTDDADKEIAKVILPPFFQADTTSAFLPAWATFIDIESFGHS